MTDFILDDCVNETLLLDHKYQTAEEIIEASASLNKELLRFHVIN